MEIKNENTRFISGLCLEIHDLAASKIAAGREKDAEFVSDLARLHMLDPGTVEERVSLMPVTEEEKTRLRERWQRWNG